MIKRYEIRESKKFYGKYVVVDLLLCQVHEFYNIASARTFIKDRTAANEKQT